MDKYFTYITNQSNDNNFIYKNDRSYLDYIGDLDNKEAIRKIHNHLKILGVNNV